VGCEDAGESECLAREEAKVTDDLLVKHTTLKFRAYPSTEQSRILLDWMHAQRALWNAAHAQRLERVRRIGYDQRGRERLLTGFGQAVELTECRDSFSWLRAVPRAMQHQLLMQLELAWKRYLARTSGIPSFKQKRDRLMALTMPARVCNGISRKRVGVPKLGDLRVRGHSRIHGRPVHVSVSCDLGQWFVSISCRVEASRVPAPRGVPVGIDVGIQSVVSDSLGCSSGSMNRLGHGQRQMRKRQLLVSRRRPVRGQAPSNSYLKAVRKAALLYRKVRRQRADFLHNLSSHYAKSHGTVVIEDLKVSNMTRSARGTKEKPGKGVRAKAGLNREILNVGWYELRRQLTYKCEWYGSKLIVVDPKYTSQACQQCGCIDRRSRATQMLFICVECGFIDHADVNAAKNILDRGIGPAGATTVAACGGFDSSRPTKQEESR